jgi:hypothetical protein
VFDIENKQEHYACCLEIIRAVARNDFKIIEETMNAMFLRDRVRITILDFLPQHEYNRTDFYKLKSELKAVDKIIKHSTLSSVDELADSGFTYYFRIVASDKTDVVEFIYYALMLQSPYIHMGKIITRVEVAAESDMFRFRHYVQALPIEYINFLFYYDRQYYRSNLYIKEQGTNQEINRTHRLLPVIEIRQETYEYLREYQSLKLDKSKTRQNFPYFEQKISELTLSNNNVITNSIVRQANHILSHGISNSLPSNPNDRYDYTDRVVNEMQIIINEKGGITVIHYYLLTMLLRSTISEQVMKGNTGIEMIKEWIADGFGSTLPFAEGMLQVIENIIFHAESEVPEANATGKGLLSARWHDVESEYLNKKIGGILINNNNRKLPHLEFFIVDFNEKTTVMDTFLSQDKNGTCLETLSILRNNRRMIRLADFMGEYEDSEVKEIWEKFRISHPAKCQGLLKFAHGLMLSGAIVQARSSTYFVNTRENVIWHRDFRDLNKKKSDLILRYSDDRAYIPGTQYNIIFPVKNKQKQAYPVESALRTTHETYSRHLNYVVRQIPNVQKDMVRILSDIKVGLLLNPKNYKGEKDYRWSKFKVFWNNLYKRMLKKYGKEAIYVFDFNDAITGQSIEDNPVQWMEPMCKGFLDSYWMTDNGKLNYVSFTNYDDHFAEKFRATLIVSYRHLINTEKRIYFTNGIWNNNEPNMIGREVLTKASLGIAKPVILETDHVPWQCFNLNGTNPRALQKLKKSANNDLFNNVKKSNYEDKDYGHKLTNTHVKLGNKAHLNTFYEMTTYFMKQEVAKDLAFILLHRLLNNDNLKKLLRKKNIHICFYGYGAYSRTIVNAAYEIFLRYMGNGNEKKISFVIYQTKQAGQTMDYEEHIYFSKD